MLDGLLGTKKSNEEKARAAFEKGLNGFVGGDGAAAEQMMDAMEQAAELDDAPVRALMLADFAQQCQAQMEHTEGDAQTVLHQLRDATACQSAIALYQDYPAGEKLFTETLETGPQRPAFDAALHTAGGDFADVLSAGWQAMMRQHIAHEDVQAAADCVQGAASSYARSRGPDSEEAVRALERGQAAFAEAGLFEVAVQVGELALGMLDRATYAHEGWQRLGVLTNTALFALQTGDGERATAWIDTAAALGQALGEQLPDLEGELDADEIEAASTMLDQLPNYVHMIKAGVLSGAHNDENLHMMAMYIPNADAPPTLYVTQDEVGDAIQWAAVAEAGQPMSIMFRDEPFELYTQVLTAEEHERIQLGESPEAFFDATRAMLEDITGEAPEVV